LINYDGAWRFEFPNRNVSVDEDGNIVLLDVFFDQKACSWNTVLQGETRNSKLRMLDQQDLARSAGFGELQNITQAGITPAEVSGKDFV
jgi:uncharacterized protein YfaQ (DUF2300 family)